MALMAFAFLNGVMAGPFLNVVMELFPGMISQALAYTASSFGAFSLVSLFSERRSYLFLGGIISTLLAGLSVYIFIGLFTGNAYGLGYLICQLLVTSMTIMYDTQVIVELSERGDRDVPSHTMRLFEDVFRMFMYIVQILLENQNNEKKRRK